MKDGSGSSRRNFLKQIAAVSLGGVLTGVYGRVGGMSLVPSPYQPMGLLPKRSGLGKFVPVMLTPFKSDKSLDMDSLSRLTDFYQQAGAKGMFANCLSSEMYSLTPTERIMITDHVVKRVGSGIPVVSTGSFGESLEDKAVFTQKMHDIGVNAVILITSHFADKQEDDGILIRNLEKFLILTGTLPLGTYECPTPYKRVLSPEVYTFLLKSDRFIYHKDTSEDIQQIEAKLRLSRNSRLKLFNAHLGSAVSSLQAGAEGLSPISGNFYPEIIHWVCENAANPEKQKDVAWIQAELDYAEPIISRVYPFSAKYFLRKRGLPIELQCRVQRRALVDADKEALDAIYMRFLGWCDRLGIKPVSCC